MKIHNDCPPILRVPLAIAAPKDSSDSLEDAFRGCLVGTSRISVSQVIPDPRDGSPYFVVEYPHALQPNAIELVEALEDDPFYLSVTREYEKLIIYVPPSFRLTKGFGEALVDCLCPWNKG